MKIFRVVIPAALVLICATAFAYEDRTDRELRSDLKNVDREISDHADLARMLERSARYSSNTQRNKAISALQEHMTAVVRQRESELGQKYTIKQHGQEVESGLTDAAEVGTPMASKKTRRRMRRGMAEELPDRLRRLARMQTLVVNGTRVAYPAAERQDEMFEMYVGVVTEFGTLLETDRHDLLAEIESRQPAPAAADTVTAATDSTAG